MTLPRFRPLTIAVAAGIIVLLAVLYVILTFTVHARSMPPASLKPMAMTRPPVAAPQVAFGDASGKMHALGEFHGRYVLLNLWAPWCAPCVKELPALAKLQAAMPRSRFAVVAVDVGRGSAGDATRFLDAHQAGTLKTYVDSDIALMRALGALGLPLSVLIDPNGREIARVEGPADWSAPQSVAWFRRLTKS